MVFMARRDRVWFWRAPGMKCFVGICEAPAAWYAGTPRFFPCSNAGPATFTPFHPSPFIPGSLSIPKDSGAKSWDTRSYQSPMRSGSSRSMRPSAGTGRKTEKKSWKQTRIKSSRASWTEGRKLLPRDNPNNFSFLPHSGYPAPPTVPHADRQPKLFAGRGAPDRDSLGGGWC